MPKKNQSILQINNLSTALFFCHLLLCFNVVDAITHPHDAHSPNDHEYKRNA